MIRPYILGSRARRQSKAVPVPPTWLACTHPGAGPGPLTVIGQGGAGVLVLDAKAFDHFTPRGSGSNPGIPGRATDPVQTYFAATSCTTAAVRPRRPHAATKGGIGQ